MYRGLDATETVVGLAGDWEANAAWARHALGRFAEHGVTCVFHLGDLTGGPGPHSRQFVSELEGACRHHGITIYLTPGNHEDHPRLSDLPADDTGLAWLTGDVAVLPRGHRWTMAGKTFVSLGGAPSVDYPRRIAGKTWFPYEALTDDDVARVAAGGPGDVMLTHDAPAPATPAVERIVDGDHGSTWTRKGLDYAAAGRTQVTRAFQAVRPRLLAHGHYHVRDDALLQPEGWDHACRTLSLNRHGQVGNLALLDLATKGVSDVADDPVIGHHWL